MKRRYDALTFSWQRDCEIFQHYKYSCIVNSMAKTILLMHSYITCYSLTDCRFTRNISREMALVLVLYIIYKYIYVSYIFLYFVFSIVPGWDQWDKSNRYSDSIALNISLYPISHALFFIGLLFLVGMPPQFITLVKLRLVH